MERKKLARLILIVVFLGAVILLVLFKVKDLMKTEDAQVGQVREKSRDEAKESQETDKSETVVLSSTSNPLDDNKSASESSYQYAQKDYRGIEPPPVHSNLLPSTNNPKETVTSLLEVAKEGNNQFFVDFLSYEARNNPSIILIPSGWNIRAGSFLAGEPTRGDGNTLNVSVSFYQNENKQVPPFEKISYHLVFSFEKWLIYETAYER